MLNARLINDRLSSTKRKTMENHWLRCSLSLAARSCGLIERICISLPSYARKLLPEDKPLSFPAALTNRGGGGGRAQKFHEEDSQKIFFFFSFFPFAARRNPEEGRRSFVWKIYKKLTNETLSGGNSRDTRKAISFNRRTESEYNSEEGKLWNLMKRYNSRDTLVWK